MATSGRSEAENTTAHGSDEGFVRALGLFPATTVNMSQMVGIGPFITIPLMISAMGGPQALIGWVLGAVLAMADGLVWAELGAAMPAAGGSYFERLVGLCEGEERVCLMCSEAVWWRCHRRMIADALVVRGFSVEHVLGERRTTLHTFTPWAEVVGGTGLHYPPDR
jgi:hypothetical protein